MISFSESVEIPNGLKIKDRVVWYSNENEEILGTVLRLYRDSTDKYTAIVKFVSYTHISILSELDGL